MSSTSGLQRHLNARHMRFMAIGTAIGVGLFLGSATAIKQAGPSILLAYLFVGFITYILLRAIGEMAVHEPVAGSFTHYANKYVHPLLGYTVGWGYWIYWCMVGVAEVTAVSLYMGYWYPDTPQWIWALASIITMGAVNFMAVKLYGEFEFWFSLIKVVTILAFIGIGTSMIIWGFGNHGVPIGLSNLWAHGGFFPNGITGFLFALQMVIFAYAGSEMIGFSAGEATDPEKTIPMAINSFIWRILFFYMGALFVVLAVFPWNQLDVNGSPFVSIFSSMGLGEAAGIINFVVITAALSSCNTGIYTGARTLMSLAESRQAPALFNEVSKNGMPNKAIIATVIVPAIGVIMNYLMPDKVFIYMTSGATFIVLLIWIAILVVQIIFRKGLNRQQRNKLSYKAILWPYGSWFAIAFLTMAVAMLGYSPETRMSVYVGVPLMIGVVLSYFMIGLNKKK